LAENQSLNGEAYNFGPPAHQNHSVRELIDEMGIHWSSVCWKDTSQSEQYLHEAGLLKLNCDKALFELQWQPTLDFHETVRMTVEWYKDYYENSSKSMFDFTMFQIDEYMKLSERRNISKYKND